MLTGELVALVKTNLKINDDTKDLIIKDTIQDALNYCNLKELPIELEAFIRKKVQSIIEYETENTNNVSDIKSITEGDTTITYNVSSKITKEIVYGLSDKDKRTLQLFRMTRK